MIEAPPIGTRVEVTSECCGQILARTTVTWFGSVHRFTTPAHPGAGHRQTLTATWRAASSEGEHVDP